jgi:hypothetical protein
VNLVDRVGQGCFAQQDAPERRRPTEIDQPGRVALARECFLQMIERRQYAATGRDPSLDGGDALGAQLFDRLEGCEDSVELGGDVVDLVDHLHIAVQDHDGIGRLVTTRRDRVEDRRELALTHAGAERAGQLNELRGLFLQPDHAAEGREVAADRAREQRAEAVEKPDGNGAGDDRAGGQQDKRGEELGPYLAEPADSHPLRGGRLRGGWVRHAGDGPPSACSVPHRSDAGARD